MAEEAIPQDENLRLAGLLFQASNGNMSAASDLKASLVDRIALPFYQSVVTKLVSSFVESSLSVRVELL